MQDMRNKPLAIIVSLAVLLALLLGGLLLWQQQRRQAELAEHGGVFQFLAAHPQLKALVGDPVPAKLLAVERREAAVRYLFDIGGTRPLYAWIEARPSSDPQLLCVTRLRGRDDAPQDQLCANDPVVLPPVPA
jgi:hypothetical protein